MWMDLIEVKDLFLASLKDRFEAQKKQAQLMVERSLKRYFKALTTSVFNKFEQFHCSYRYFWLVE